MILLRLAAISLACLVSSNLNAQQHLALVRGTAYDVSLIDSITHLRIPVELGKDVKTDKLDIEILDIKSDKIPSTVKIAGFDNIFFKDTLGKTFINIDIFNRPPIQPAAYVLELRIKKKEEADSPVQKIPVTITVNAAVIKSLSNIAVVRKDPFFFADYKIYGNELIIQESGRKALLSLVNVRTVKIVDAKNEKVAANIHFSPIQNIGPGDASTIKFEISGDLPIGKTTATLEVNSSQFTEPVPLTIEITTKRGTYFLIAVIILGLLIGYIVRIVLDRRIKVNTARLGAIELLEIIATEIDTRPDAIFVKKANVIQADLGKAIKKAKDDEITAATNTAKDTLNIAITDHNTRRTQTQQILANLQSLLDFAIALPPEFGSVSGDSQSELSDAADKNMKGDPTTAAEIVGRIVPGLNLRFNSTIKNYRSQLITALTQLNESNFKIPEIKDSAGQILTQLNGIVLSPPAELDKPLLTTIHGISFRTEELLGQAGRLIHKKLSDITAAFNTANVQLPDKKLIDQLNTNADAILKNLERESVSVLDKIMELPANLNSLQDELIKAMKAQTTLTNENPGLVQTNQTDKTAIETDLNNGLYSEAAQKIINFIKKNKTANAEALELNKEAISMPEMRFINIPAVPTFNSSKIGSQLQDLPKSLDAMHEQTLKTVAIAKFWQTLVAGLLITLTGYALYADSFMGTPGDIASVFFWAFLLDVSVATLTGTFLAKIVRQ